MLIAKGGTRTRSGISVDADLWFIARDGGCELVRKLGVYYHREGLYTERLGAFGTDREALAVWRGRLRTGGVDI